MSDTLASATHIHVAPRFLVAIGVVTIFVGLLLFQARPLLVFHFSVRPEIEGGRVSRALEVPTEYLPSTSLPGWTEIVVGDTSLVAPVVDDPKEIQRQCAKNCILQLERGQLAFLAGAAPGSFDTAKLEFAPSSDDLSFWRSREANWSTVEALAVRGRPETGSHETFRYASDGSQGIVSRIESVGVERFVVYSYSLNGDAGRTLGFSRTGPELVRRVLGSLRVRDASPSGTGKTDCTASRVANSVANNIAIVRKAKNARCAPRPAGPLLASKPRL